MASFKYLTRTTNELIDQYPQHKEQLVDLYLLAKAEIEDGESEDNEVDLALNSMQEYLEDKGVIIS